MNQTLLDMLGYKSVDEFRRVSIKERFTPESYAEYEARQAKRERGEYVPSEFEIGIVRPDGEIRHLVAFRKEVLWDGKQQYQILYLDNTERRWAERALQFSEENFRNSLDNLPLGVHIITAEGESLYTNQALLEIFGSDSFEEFRGRPLSKRLTPESFAEYQARQERRLKGEHVPSECEISVIGKDGEVRRVEAFRKEILWNSKRQLQILYLDITERRRAEELRQKMLEYEELDKVKTAVLSVVSHELRTPLATIKGYATMLLRYNTRLEVEEKLKYLQSIDGATDRLTDLVNHLLDMSRLDAGLLRMEKAPTRVSDLLKKAVAEACMTRKNHDIKLETSKRLPTLSLDPRRIRQVIDNLIDNACKYSSTGTEILVTACRKRNELVISVSDHGVGIPESEVDRIFDRMYRLEQRLARNPTGLGLGLSLCKGLVEAHGGRIWLKSKEGKGSTFSFCIPVESTDEK